MKNITPLYKFRMHSRLTLNDLAYLLGYNHHSNVLRYENETMSPSVKITCGYSVLFNTSLRSLFPHLYAKQKEAIRNRITKRLQELQGTATSRSDKRRVLALQRLQQRLNQNELL